MTRSPSSTRRPGQPISFARPAVGEAEVEAVRQVLESRWLTQGPAVKAFEEEFAAYVGAEFACAVSSCTTALHTALLAVGVGPGDEVIAPSHSFIATANAIRYCGAVPVFVDIDLGSYNVSPDSIEKAITSRTTAILCVHQLGMPADLEDILSLAHRNGLKVVEDAACAAGSEILWHGEWQKLGRPHGDIACFSFHPRKLLTTGDGGMLTTNSEAVDRKARLLRQHGMSVPAEARHQSKNIIFEEYKELGFNFRMTDLQAAIGREQLKRLPWIVAQHRQLAASYRELITQAVPEVTLPVEARWARSNWQSYCVGLPEGCCQRTVMQSLLDRGIPTRRGVMCAHREPAYVREEWRCAGSRPDCRCSEASCIELVRSETAQDRSVLLPIHSELTRDDQVWIVESLASAIRQGR